MDGVELKMLKKAHDKVARLVVSDPVYLPVFQRLEAELAAAAP